MFTVSNIHDLLFYFSFISLFICLNSVFVFQFFFAQCYGCFYLRTFILCIGFISIMLLSFLPCLLSTIQIYSPKCSFLYTSFNSCHHKLLWFPVLLRSDNTQSQLNCFCSKFCGFFFSNYVNATKYSYVLVSLLKVRIFSWSSIGIFLNWQHALL